MLSTEDLIDLAEDLRSAGFKAAAHQYFSAQQVLLHTAAAGITDRARLATLLGPIFCTNVMEQRRFPELFSTWLSRRFPAEHAAGKSQGSAPSAPKLGRSHVHVKIIIAVIALAFAAAAIRAYWQMQLPREVHGFVLSETATLPIEGAVVEFEDQKIPTNANGEFRIQTTVRSLPATLKVSSKGYGEATETVGKDYVKLRQHLYLWPEMPDLPTIHIALPENQVAPPTIAIAMPPAVGNDPMRIGEPRVIDLSQLLPPVRWWQRLIWSDVAWVSLPIVLFLLWQLWSWMRRPTLQRLSDRTPRSVKDVHLPGGTSPPTAALPLRRLAQELRRRRIVNSDELQVQATIEASLRNNGVFTPVRGSRAEPDYIALVDVASQADHRARLEDEILGHLLRSDVLIERYVFHGDPMLCTQVTPDSLATRVAGKTSARMLSRAQVVQLEDLQLRSPDHRVLIFSDGTQFFDAFTGALTSAGEILLRWNMPTILTSKPLEQWGEIEWALDRRGFSVLPISRAGLTTLMSTSSGAPADPFQSSAHRPKLSRFDRNPERLLERDSPSDSDIELLCKDLLRDFGDRGFAWIAACAAYPEIHWGITLRLGAALIPNDTDQEKILPRMARLAWFRDGYMPNWARKALLERMSPGDEATTRALLHQILASLSGDPNQEVPLRIALEAPRSETFVRRISDSVRNYFARRRIWRKSERVIQAAPPASPLRDHVFLRFISGASLGKLSLSAPGTLLKLLFRGGSPLLGFQPVFALLIVLIASAVIGVFTKPMHSGSVNQQVAWSSVARSGSILSVYGSMIEAAADDPDRIITAGIIETFPDGRSVLKSNFAIDKEDEGGISPHGRYIVLNKKGSFRVVDTLSGKVVLESETSCAKFSGCMAFSGDENMMAWTINKEIPAVSIRNVETGGEFSLASGLIPGTLRRIALNRDGSQLAASTSSGIYEINSADRNVRLIRPGLLMDRLIYGENDRLLGITFERPAAIWDLAANRQLADNNEGIMSDGEYVVSESKPLFAMITGYSSDKSIKLIDTTNGTSLDKVFEPPKADYESISLAADGSQLVATAEDGKISVWAIPEGFPEPPRPGRSFALMIARDWKGDAAPVNDATNIAGLLRVRYGFGVTILSNESANKANILEALRQLRSILEPQDRLLVYIAGSRISVAPESEFGFTLNFSNNDAIDEDLSGGELRRELRTLPVASVLTIVTTNFDGIAGRAVLATDDGPRGPVQELIAPQVERGAFVSASGAYSPFAKAMFEVLDSANGVVSARTLRDETARLLRPTAIGPHELSYNRFDEAGPYDTRTFEFPAPLTPAVRAQSQAPLRNTDIRTPPTQNSPPANPPVTTTPTEQAPARTLEDDVTLSVVPGKLDFAWRRLGDPGAVGQSFNVRNDGPYRWDLTSRFEGTRPIAFRTSGCEVLEPNNYCAGTIFFEASAEGQHDSTLILSGTVERPQGTLSAKIPPIEVSGRVIDTPWRLEVRGNGQVTQDETTRSWNVPEIVFRAPTGQRRSGEVQLQNKLDRPIKLTLIKPRQTYGSTVVNVEKNSCEETLVQNETCYFTFNFNASRGDVNANPAPVRPSAPTALIIDGASPTQASPTQASPTTQSAEESRAVLVFAEEGEKEIDPILRDRARIVITSGGDAGAKAN